MRRPTGRLSGSWRIRNGRPPALDGPSTCCRTSCCVGCVAGRSRPATCRGTAGPVASTPVSRKGVRRLRRRSWTSTCNAWWSRGWPGPRSSRPVPRVGDEQVAHPVPRRNDCTRSWRTTRRRPRLARSRRSTSTPAALRKHRQELTPSLGHPRPSRPTKPESEWCRHGVMRWARLVTPLGGYAEPGSRLRQQRVGGRPR
jgi:hypothetical protein